MAAGVIIGRVAVKVIPDTSDFRDDLQRDLDRIERSLEGIEIKIDLDENGVVQKAKAAQEKAQQQMKDLRLKVNLDNEQSVQDAMKRLDREITRLGEIDLDVDLDEDSLNAAKDLLSEQLEGIRRMKIEVDEADPASVRSAVDAINRELEKIKRVEMDISFDAKSLESARNDLRDKLNDTYRQVRETVARELKTIQLGMDVDPVQAARTVRKIELLLEQIEDLKMTIRPEMDERSRFTTLRQIQDLRDKVEDMKMTIHPSMDGPAALALSARLAVLARDRFVEIVPRLNRAAATTVGMALARMSGARLISVYMRDLYNSIIQFDKAIPKIIALSLAIGGIGAVGLASASNLAALSASLASIAPAALAIPGILGGMAVGLGVFVAAMKDFNTVFPDVQDSLAKLQDSISDNFWDGAKASMREMIDTLLPAVSRGFEDVATRLGNFTSRFTDAVTTQLAPALKPMFDSLAFSIDIAAGAADNIVGIITTLGTVGSSYLPSLARWFRDITEQFDAFLKRSTESGEIFNWIDAGVDALQDLARVGKNAALILYDIAQAAQAAGGSSLGALADGLAEIRDITSSASFQGGLTQAFKAAHDAIQNIVLISGPAVKNFFKELGQLATDVLPIVGTAIGTIIREVAQALAQPEVTDGIREMFAGIMSGIDKLTPAFAPLGVAIATLGPLVGDLADNLGGVLGAAIPPVAEALVRMGDAVAPLIPQLGQALLTAVEALAPVIENLATVFVNLADAGAIDLVGNGFQLFADAINAIPDKVLTGIVVGVGGLATAMSLLSGALFLANGALGVWNVVAGIATGVTTGLGVAIRFMLGPIGLAITAIGLLVAAGIWLYKNWDTVKAKAKEAWAAVKKELSDSMKNAEKNIKDAGNAIKRFLSDTWAAIKQRASQNWQEIKTNLSQRMDEIKQKFVTRWNEIKSDISARMSQIKSDISTRISEIKANISTRLTEIKQTFVTRWNEIKQDVTTKWNEIKQNITTRLAEIKSTITSKLGELKAVATQKWGEFKAAAKQKMDEAVADVKALPGKIKSALGNLGGLLVSAGADLVRGFIRGIGSMAGAAVSAATNMATSAISAAKAKLGISSPSKVFQEIGINLGEGMVLGIKKSENAVKKTMESLADTVANTDITAPIVAQPKAAARKGLVGGVRSAVRDSVSPDGGKTLIYHAAPGSSLGSEEDLFAAAERGRMVGW